MALNIAGYVTPEQSFEGLHGAAGMLRQQAQVDEQRKTKAAAQRASMAQMLMGSLDQKDFLTGTAYDPQVVQGLGSLMEEGMQLANMEGMDASMLKMALAPKLNKLAQYTTAVKGVNERIREQLKMLPNDSGYDKLALEREARNAAFLGEGGELRDMSQVDPEADYITAAIQRAPHKVTTGAIFDQIVKNTPKYTEVKSVKRTNAKGGVELRKSKVTAPQYMIVDDEGEMVPKFEIAKDGDQIITSTFQTPTGVKKAPVRMVTDEVFTQIMSSNPAAADYIRGQVMQAMGPNGDLNSPQARNLAKAFMYDELKARKGGAIEDVEEVRAAPAPRITVNTGGGKQSQTPTVMDYYDDMYAFAENAAKKGFVGTALTNLDAEAQQLVLDTARKLKGNNELTNADIMLRSEGGTLYIMDVSKLTGIRGNMKPPSDAYIAPLTKTGVNVKANAPLGQKAKAAAAQSDNKPKFVGVPSGGF